MNVKAQGLLNAAKYIEEHYGRDALADVLRACSQATRDTYTSSIAINWHPVEELCEFVQIAEDKLGDGMRKLAIEVGAAGARANMKGLLVRIASYWTRPEFLMKRAAGLWRQFNDEGTMELLDMDERHVRLEVLGVAKPNAVFCRILTGWAQETATALGVKNVVASHSECLANGGKRCIFDVRGIVHPGEGPLTGPGNRPGSFP